jgi:general secretion pathway protein F
MQIGQPKIKTDMKRVEVLLFVSELSDLLEAGMTLGQALQALANQGEGDSAQSYVCQDLCDAIVRGESFSDACARHPKTFPPLFFQYASCRRGFGRDDRGSAPSGRSL